MISSFDCLLFAMVLIYEHLRLKIKDLSLRLNNAL